MLGCHTAELAFCIPLFFLTRLDNIASTKRLIPFSDWQEGEQEIWKLQKRNPFTKSGMFGFLQN